MPFHYTEAMLHRIARDPGLPVTNPTKAIWQDPPHPLSNVQSGAFPEQAHVIVIGSGITACAVVHTILSSASIKPRITVLEARTLCSGASGRNGGHIRDSPFMYFSDLKERFGLGAAKKMLLFRSGHLKEITRIIEEESLTEVELQMVEAVDVICEEEKWASTKEELEDFENYAPQEIQRPKIWEGDTARKEFGVEKALGAISYPAATHSTYQLVAGIWSNLLERYHQYLSIETMTRVLNVSSLPRPKSGPFSFEVRTTRGKIRAIHVVHCTNSHVAHLVPGLRGKIFPVREQMTEQQFSMPEKDTKRSLVFLWRKGFDYYIHRPATKTREPAIILGGALSQSGDDGLDEFGVSSDADKGLFIAAYLRGLLPTMFNPCRDSKFISSWTGIMGWSADLIPWVGPLPESLTRRNPARVVSSSAVNLDSWGELPGEEWICAGYSGEGMTHAWGCGKALALMILGEDVGLEEWFPKEYRVTEERAKEADVRKLKELY